MICLGTVTVRSGTSSNRTLGITLTIVLTLVFVGIIVNAILKSP